MYPKSRINAQQRLRRASDSGPHLRFPKNVIQWFLPANFSPDSISDCNGTNADDKFSCGLAGESERQFVQEPESHPFCAGPRKKNHPRQITNENANTTQ